jgi:hypothetical protein
MATRIVLSAVALCAFAGSVAHAQITVVKSLDAIDELTAMPSVSRPDPVVPGRFWTIAQVMDDAGTPEDFGDDGFITRIIVFDVECE